MHRVNTSILKPVGSSKQQYRPAEVGLEDEGYDEDELERWEERKRRNVEPPYCLIVHPENDCLYKFSATYFRHKLNFRSRNFAKAKALKEGGAGFVTIRGVAFPLTKKPVEIVLDSRSSLLPTSLWWVTEQVQDLSKRLVALSGKNHSMGCLG